MRSSKNSWIMSQPPELNHVIWYSKLKNKILVFTWCIMLILKTGKYVKINDDTDYQVMLKVNQCSLCHTCHQDLKIPKTPKLLPEFPSSMFPIHVHLVTLIVFMKTIPCMKAPHKQKGLPKCWKMGLLCSVEGSFCFLNSILTICVCNNNSSLTALKYSHTAMKYSHTALKYSHIAMKYSHTALKYSNTALKYSNTAFKYSHIAFKYSRTALKYSIIQLWITA